VRVAVAMSGGVDSLKAATLLRAQGHEVLALYMRLLPASRSRRWDAEAVLQIREQALQELSARLAIPLHVVDLRQEFDELVIQPFLDAYRSGFTPNPCILCNPRIKFRLLLDVARQLGADRLATGHYVRLLPPQGGCTRFRLLRGRDPQKDQSYFLCALTQEQLASALFPLGDELKTEVQRWAEDAGWAAQLAEESQEICFIPAGHYREFLEDRLETRVSSPRGAIVDREGRVLGEHQGIFSYTVGQRRGLGIASSAPYYVVALDPERNRVIIGRADDLQRQELIAENVNWVSVAPPHATIRCQVRLRNQHRPAAARVIPLSRAEVQIRFDTPQRAVTPGQTAVFYDEDLVLGGGIISGTQPE
jgi:tRNA-uridine 2-sulfurtransferase